jgi:hypothetical protein
MRFATSYFRSVYSTGPKGVAPLLAGVFLVEASIGTLIGLRWLLNASWTDVIVGIVFPILIAGWGLLILDLNPETPGLTVFARTVWVLALLTGSVGVCRLISATAAKAAVLCVLGGLIPLGYAVWGLDPVVGRRSRTPPEADKPAS